MPISAKTARTLLFTALVNVRAAVVFLVILLSHTLVFAQDVGVVLIDMQVYFLGSHRDEGQNPEKYARVIERQRQVLRLARELGLPVAVLEYLNVGRTNPTLMKEIANYPKAQVFQKATDGMFDEGSGVADQIERFFASTKTKTLVICGANGGYCVRSSIRGSLEKKYQVWADLRAIIEFNTRAYTYPYLYRPNEFPPELQANFHQSLDQDVIEEVLRSSRVPTSQPLCRSLLSAG